MLMKMMKTTTMNAINVFDFFKKQQKYFLIGAGFVVVVSGLALYRIVLSIRRLRMIKKITLEDPNTKYPLELIERENLTHDTRLFRFALPSNQHILGLQLGQHVYLSAKRVNQEDGKEDLIIRPYSPVSAIDETGYFELVFKVYKHGKMTQYLESMRVGQKIDVRGPTGKLAYKRQGVFELTSGVGDKKEIKQLKVTRIGMIAGGTGITPMFQIISDICRHRAASGAAADQTKVQLLFANHTEDDILLRKELEELREENKGTFDVWFTISRSTNESLWTYDVGRVNETMIRAHLPPPSDKTIILVCGPPEFVNACCIPYLLNIGHKKEQIHSF
jgi:cytochrome-b5 reductase